MMSTAAGSPFLDVPPIPDDGYAKIADRLRALLQTANNVVFVQAEAVVALEAVASSLAKPGIVALNVVTSPYGTYFGGWLRRGGAVVHDLTAPFARPMEADAVAAALDDIPGANLIALVHGETSSGILNPLPEIAALAKGRRALLVVDAVASVGAHRLEVDRLGIDVAVIGPQKALGGPAGISALAISRRAWELVGRAPVLGSSVLSLADIQRDWLDRGRGALPGTPSPIEFWALSAALDRVEAEGIDRLIARHARAAAATRAGIRALGADLWVGDDTQASALVTSVTAPTDLDLPLLIGEAARRSAAIAPGFGDSENRFSRLNHTAGRANPDAVRSNITAYGGALAALGRPADVPSALVAMDKAYAEGSLA